MLLFSSHEHRVRRGRKHGLCAEEYVPQRQFWNAYEETKHIAEGLVLERCRREGIRANIYRPSIVYGDSKSGRSLLFNALYAPVKLAHYLRTVWEKDFSENGGLRAEKMGVRMTDDGKMYIPARIERTATGALNLIAIDFLVEASMAIMEDCLDGGIFHLTNPKANTLDELLGYIEQYLNITGIRLVPRGYLNTHGRNALDKLIDSYLGVYGPYFHDDRQFDTTKAERTLSKRNIACPAFDYAVFAKCVDYAIQSEWGKRLFE